MNEVVLDFTPTNMITVVIMASLGFALIALIAQFYHNIAGKMAGN